MTLPALEGARWVVRSTTDRLLRIATDFFGEQGFTVRESAFSDSADEAGWVAIAFEAHEAANTHPRTRFSSFLRTRRASSGRSAAPQGAVVVAAARRVSSGVAELVVHPHAAPDSAPAVIEHQAALIAAALDAISAAAGAESAMLSHERLRTAPEDGCPAALATVRDVFDWR